MFGTGLASSEDAVWRVGLVLTIASTVGVALAIGGADTRVLFALTPLYLAGNACLLLSFSKLEGKPFRWPAPAWVLFALAAYSALQSVPLPLWLLGWLSPGARDIWQHALSPFDQIVDWGALSLEPGGSLREALKWHAYGLGFVGATLVAQRHGRRVPALVVYLSALVVAFATLGHGLSQATKVFGVYEPELSGSRWAVGPFLNPNTLSGYLNLGAFIGIGLAFSRRLAAYRWLLAGGVAVLLGMSVLSGSRGGVWVLPLGLLLFAVLRRAEPARRRRASADAARLGPLWVALGCTVVFVGFGASQLTWKALSDENLEKLKIAVWALPLLKEFWLFGVGRGAFGSVFPAYAPPLGNKVYAHPENFLVQWTSEWGALVTVLGLLALLWTFRRHVAIRGDSLGAGAATGVVLLFAQNIADFGLERLATPLAITWALAALWKRDPKQGVVSIQNRPLHSALVLATGACLWVLAFSFGRDDAQRSQRTLYASTESADLKNRADVDTLRNSLRAEMLRRPAEPYYSRLGAEISLRTRNPDVLKWIARALERGPNEPNAHLLTARALYSYGALNQALMELRLAAELDVSAAVAAGKLAAKWSKSLDGLLRAAPPGALGAKVLTSGAAHPDASDELREQALRAATQRNPEDTQARLALVKHLANNLQRGRCAPGAACAADALRQADALIQHAPDLALGTELKARILRLGGRETEAEGLLAAACPKYRDEEQRRCLLARLRAVSAKEKPSLDQVMAIVQVLDEQPCGSGKACSRLAVECGNALVRAGDGLAAMEQFERASRQDPNLPILFRVAELAVELGQFRRSEQALSRAETIATPAQHKIIRAKRDSLRGKMLKHFKP